jgi:hypothetical protein
MLAPVLVPTFQEEPSSNKVFEPELLTAVDVPAGRSIDGKLPGLLMVWPGRRVVALAWLIAIPKLPANKIIALLLMIMNFTLTLSPALADLTPVPS